MKSLVVIIFLIPTVAASQTISIAPVSFQAWGVTPSISMISGGYKNFKSHFVFPHAKAIDRNGNPTHSNWGISYRLKAINYVRPGIALFTKRFPTDSGQRFNFIIDIGYSFDIVRISYVHISNGFIDDFNPGMDVISLSVHI